MGLRGLGDSPHCSHSLAQKRFNLLTDGANVMWTVRSQVSLPAEKFPSVSSASGSFYNHHISLQVAQGWRFQMLESSHRIQE